MVPVAAKAGALLAVAAAGSTSIWYFSDSIFGTSLVSIAEDQESSYPDNSIGKNYSKYFLSSKSNENIWKKRFEGNKVKLTGTTKPKDKFGTVTEGYSDKEGNQTALNKVCDAAYKETTSTNLVEDEPSDASNTNQFVKRNIWKFCALGDIVTVGEDSTVNYNSTDFPSTKVGGEATNKKLFVSTKAKDNVNDWFWNLKTKEFWSGTAPALAGHDQNENVFKKLKEDASKKNSNIKDTCEEAYKKETSKENGKKNKEDALTFCSISLKLPSVSP